MNFNISILSPNLLQEGPGGLPRKILKCSGLNGAYHRHIFPELRCRLRLVLHKSWVVFIMRIWHLKNCICESAAARNFRFPRKSNWKKFLLGTPVQIFCQFYHLPTTSVDIFFYNFRRPRVSFRRSGALGGKKKKETSSNQKKSIVNRWLRGTFDLIFPKKSLPFRAY